MGLERLVYKQSVLAPQSHFYLSTITIFVTYSKESAQYLKFRRANVITVLT
jgi:hypothetical protein